MEKTIIVRIGDKEKPLVITKTATVRAVIEELQKDFPDVTLMLMQGGAVLKPYENVYNCAARPFLLVRNDFLAHISTKFNAQSKGKVRKYCLQPSYQYSNVTLCIETRASCSTSVSDQAITFRCPSEILALLEALNHRRFVVMASKGRATTGNFFKDVCGVFVFVFVELGEFAAYKNALSKKNGYDNHLVVPMPPGYESRGAPTPRQFGKLFLEQLNARLKSKATHYLMVDDDWEKIVYRPTDGHTGSVDASSFVEDLFAFAQANPRLALIGLRPQKHLGGKHKNERGLTGHIEKMYVVSLDLTRDIQYLPQKALCLSATEWNRRITIEAQHLGEQIYGWKCRLVHHLCNRTLSERGRELDWSELVKAAKFVGLKKADCTRMKNQVMKEMQTNRHRPSRQKELELIVTQFKLTNKTCLTTGEDYRFAGQSLEVNGLDSCMMLNWFYVIELRKVAKDSQNQTGSFLPTPVQQHERIMRYI